MSFVLALTSARIISLMSSLSGFCKKSMWSFLDTSTWSFSDSAREITFESKDSILLVAC